MFSKKSKTTLLSFIFSCLFFLLPLLLSAQNDVVGNGQQWSMEISNFRVLEQRKTNVVVQFDVTNTGKSDIDLPYNTPIGNIEIVFDDSLKKSQYAYYQHLIKEQLAEEELFLPVGLVKLDFQTEILLPKSGIFKKKNKDKKQVENAVVKDSILVKNQVDTTENKELKTPKKDNFSYSSPNKAENFDFFKKDTSYSYFEYDTLAYVANNQYFRGIHPHKILLTFTAKDSILNLFEEMCFTKPDLVIDSFFVKKKNKKQVVLGFLVRNQGNQRAYLVGETPSIEDNVSVKSYFSLLPKKTNGAIFVRGMYMDKEAKSVENQLLPSQRIWLEIEIPLKLKTKFAPYIVLEINGTNSIEECSVDNNFIAVKIE